MDEHPKLVKQWVTLDGKSFFHEDEALEHQERLPYIKEAIRVAVAESLFLPDGNQMRAASSYLEQRLLEELLRIGCKFISVEAPGVKEAWQRAAEREKNKREETRLWRSVGKVKAKGEK